MATNDVISNLVRDLEPVSPLPLPRVRLSRWVAVAAAVAMVAVAALGRRGDLAAAVFTVPFQAHTLLLLVAAISAAGAALALAIPGEPLAGWRRTAPMVSIVAWGAWLAGELLPFASNGGEAWPIAAGWGCVAKAFAIGVTPGVVLAIMVGRGAPVDVRGALTFAGLAAAAVGALGVELTCPVSHPLHLLLWHAGPVAAAVLLASRFGPGAFAAFSMRWSESA